MSISIGLSAYYEGYPTEGTGWDVDFEAGGPGIVVPDDLAAFPVSDMRDSPNPFTPGLHWRVHFSPPLTDTSLAGRPVSDLLDNESFISGSYYGDRLLLTSHDDYAVGGDGDDVLIGRGGNDTLYGDDGEDYLEGGAGSDILIGGENADTYRIDEFDTIIEYPDNSYGDTVEVGFTYSLWDGLENVRLLGAADIDATGTKADNILWGNDGANSLYGNRGSDKLYGGKGDDRLSGGLDKDVLTGGVRRDSFLFDSAGKKNFDVVTDFSAKAGDRVELILTAFRKLKAADSLKRAYFDSGDKSADDRNDHIIYNKKSGALFYDPDGTGGQKAAKIAVLEGGPKLKAADFDIV